MIKQYNYLHLYKIMVLNYLNKLRGKCFDPLNSRPLFTKVPHTLTLGHQQPNVVGLAVREKGEHLFSIPFSGQP